MTLTIKPGVTLRPGINVAVPLPPISYAIDSIYGAVNEGVTMPFTVATAAVPDGTTLYWTIENLTNAPSTRFTTYSGSVTMAGGTASFNIYPIANHQTEGDAYFQVFLRTGSTSGTKVAQCPYTKLIADTSLDPTYAVTAAGAATSINEGSTLTFNVTTTDVDNGTTLYWTIANTTTGNADFSATSGTVTISSNTGSFTVTPVADTTTEGAETFTVQVRTVSTSGTVVAVSLGKTVNDTSLDPPVPGAGVFVFSSDQSLQVNQLRYTAAGAGYGATYGSINTAPIYKGDYPQPQAGWIAIGNSGAGPYRVTLTNVSQTTDTWILYWDYQFANNLYKGDNWTLYDPSIAPFNLGTTWTIEWWQNANHTSLTAFGGISGLFNQVGWSTTNAVVIALSDDKLVFLSRAGTANDDVRYNEPPAGVWTHVAIVNNAGTQKVFYNGVEQTKVSGTFGTASYTNSVDPLYIGRLGPANGGTFDGKITNVRITDQAQYSGTFTPDVVPALIAGHTRLLWTPTNLSSFVDTGDSALSITNNSNVSFATTTYPSLSTVRQSVALTGGSPKSWLTVSGGSYFNLGTTWTIEYWSKAVGASSTGTIYSVMGQGYDAGSRFDIIYYNGRLCVKNDTNGLVGEPTPGVWTHVALSSNAGNLKVFYDGVSVYEGQINYSLSDTSTPLYIGRRGTGDFQYFSGKLTNIRICSTAKYSTDFIPNILPTLDSGHTAFMFNPTNRQASDEGDNGLRIINWNDDSTNPRQTFGVTYSTEYPQSVTGVVHPYNGGSLGTIYCLAGNPKLASFQAIPVGAKITSNIANFGIRAVTVRQASGSDWQIIYDFTGLTGYTSDTDTFNFFW